MDGADVARRRLVAQSIAGATLPSVEAAATSLLATQAQDFHGAKWALALRSTGLETDVDRALAGGTIVRTWPMRGTLLFLARADARWLTELLAPRSFAASRGVWRAAGLVESDFERAADIARDVLSGERALSRAALQAEFEAGGIETGRGRGALLLRRIAGEAVIVFGPPRGTEQTFALLDEWVPEAEGLEREAAMTRLATRYFSGHGPATADDLAWWSGLTVTDARRAVALAGDSVVDTGDGLFAGAEDPAPALPSRGDVRLLPPFDELLLGYRERSASLQPEHFARVVPYSNGLFGPTLTLDGRVVGLWRRTLAGSGAGASVEVTLDPFEPLPDSVLAAAERRAAAYARYLGRTLLFSPAP